LSDVIEELVSYERLLPEAEVAPKLLAMIRIAQ
jgi:hypothetical protein